MKNDKMQAAYYSHDIRVVESLIDTNLNNIKFEDLSNEQFTLIHNSMIVTNDILRMVIKDHKKSEEES